ncbi:phage tail domain-containing protein [Paenibacillus sp. W2I17]|uniref:phage tail domain-containing protein n=1 Tax=Paenibacillus sp. W2I17 TaxID=3042311 RepID=UPI00277D1BBD|nr:phage tail domain-containing protein [Paenibacillus sp. W2I17]MDQ0657524.1 hypothetical protein [Paenibacillus sp. W2I17]
MANWLSVTHQKGHYVSRPIQIPIESGGVFSRVNWVSEASSESSRITVQTRHSMDGMEWSSWETCINDGIVPGLSEDTAVDQHHFMYRVLFDTNDLSKSPKLKEITFSFEPVLVLFNKGDQVCKPEIWIHKQGNGDFQIDNQSRHAEEFRFKNLVHDEEVYVDNERQHIESSLPVTYRYKDFNDQFLSLSVGKNILRVRGDARIQFRYQFKLLQ